MTMPDFEEWAVVLWSNKGPRCKDVKEALTQAFEQGRSYEKIHWYEEQDKECEHISNGLSYLTCPPQYKCMKCGELYK